MTAFALTALALICLYLLWKISTLEGRIEVMDMNMNMDQRHAVREFYNE